MSEAAGRPRVLITCPPMLATIGAFRHLFSEKGIELSCPKVVQRLSEEELMHLVPESDGWIIGDDPASGKVLAAGKAGRLRAAVKWGVGTDNVALDAAKRLGIPVANTPGMFGGDVADVAMSYLTALARETFQINRGVREGGWPKPCGISLRNRYVGVIGFGDVGRNLVRRLCAADAKAIIFDPALPDSWTGTGAELSRWPLRLGDCEFLVFACSLNSRNIHMLNQETLSMCRDGVRIVNVARGQLIDEDALAEGLATGRVHSAALDVMEVEPLPCNSPLRQFPQCIFGSHNSSNTADAVRAASFKAIEEIFRLLGVK